LQITELVVSDARLAEGPETGVHPINRSTRGQRRFELRARSFERAGGFWTQFCATASVGDLVNVVNADWPADEKG
jgi:hypothetical protein